MLRTLYLLLTTSTLLAADPQKATEWQGYPRTDSQCEQRPYTLVAPKNAAEGRPWIWRTEFFGHEPQADVALLAAGYHVAYISMPNLYGGPPAMQIMDGFHLHCTQHHGLAQKVVLEGFSRGGLYALNWAARQPGKVAALYLDAPVCDFKSWPAAFSGLGKASPKNWEECKAVYGLKDDAGAKAFPLNPVDNLGPLAQHAVPILSVCGDADQVVPLSENSALLKQRYTTLGGPMELIVKAGVDHHPHSLKDPKPIVDWILKHAKR
jgi:pimeloyl-ACP methyl ester carboxylesterase